MGLFALAKRSYVCVLEYNSAFHMMALLEDASEQKTLYIDCIFIGYSRYSMI